MEVLRESKGHDNIDKPGWLLREEINKKKNYIIKQIAVDPYNKSEGTSTLGTEEETYRL